MKVMINMETFHIKFGGLATSFKDTFSNSNLKFDFWLRAGGSKSVNFYHYQYYFGGGKMTLDDTGRRYNPISAYTRLVNF